MSFRYDATGPLRQLRKMQQRLSPTGLVAVGARLAGLVHRESFKAFDTSTDPETGATWPPRKYTPTFTWRTRKGNLYKHAVKPWKLLIKTGTLRRSVAGKFQVERGKARIIGTVSGLASKYGPVHQLGGGHVPRRRFLGLGAAARKEAAAIIREHMS